MNLLRISILKALHYFDIFYHPLAIEELHNFLPIASTKHELVDELHRMKEKDLINLQGNFVSVQKNNQVFEKRKERNARAKEMMKSAHQMSGLIFRFPFIEAVFVSGSLSKGVMDENSDIDYFVITEPNRLWISRSMLMLFKKIFLFNSRKYFCVNYFIDLKHLEIEEKNQFTATELVTLLPMKGQFRLSDLLQFNTWVIDYFPNFKFEENQNQTSTANAYFEESSNSVILNCLDSFCFELHKIYWNLRFKNKLNSADFAVALKSKKGISKAHPLNAQKRIVNHFEERVKRITENHF